jgi:cobalt-zinc-cadmium efflux system membrane fusion protein
VQTVQHLLPGNYVKKGTRLTSLAHPDLLHLQSEYLQLRARSVFLEKDYERQQNLAASEAAARKRVEELESEWKATQAALQGMEAELRLLGYPLARIQAGEIQPTLPIYAPASGYLTKVNINRGKLTQPNDLLFELVDPSHVHLELQVFAKDLNRVSKGQTIRWMVPGSDSTYTGEVYLVARMIDTETKTAFIHGHFDEEDMDLAPGTFVHANILTEQQEVLGLPTDAVLEEGDRSYVFIREADGFRKLALPIMDRNASYVAIAADAIPTGAQVVLKGAYYLEGMEE